MWLSAKHLTRQTDTNARVFGAGIDTERDLKIAAIFSFSQNEDDPMEQEEDFNTDSLDVSSRELLDSIDKAVSSSPQLRSKKELIESFVASVNMIDNVDDGWHTYVTEEKEKAIAAIIADESLKDTEARRFILNAFRDGFIKTTGSDIDKILPPVSRFSGGNRKEKRQSVIEKLMTFFEEFFGIA